MSKMYVYISGPMRQRPEFNFRAFIKAEAELREQHPDAEIFSPARKDIDAGFQWEGTTGFEDLKYDLGFDLRKSLAMDMAFIAEKATRIHMLRGWADSSGARAELALAEALGIEVTYEEGAAKEETPIELDAYDRGYTAGRDDGYSDGIMDGRADDYDEGYGDGWEAAISYIGEPA